MRGWAGEWSTAGTTFSWKTEVETFKEEETCDPGDRCRMGDRLGLSSGYACLCVACDRFPIGEHGPVVSPCYWKDSRCSLGLVCCVFSISSSHYSRETGQCWMPQRCSR